MKDTPNMVWISPAGREMWFYKFPEVLQGKWEVASSRQLVYVKDGYATFRPRGRKHGGNKYQMKDGGSVWKLMMNGEVFIINKEEAEKNTSFSINWVSTF